MQSDKFMNCIRKNESGCWLFVGVRGLTNPKRYQSFKEIGEIIEEI